MAAIFGKCLLSSENLFVKRSLLSTCVQAKPVRCFSAEATAEERSATRQPKTDGVFSSRRLRQNIIQGESRIPPTARFIYPEFLPNPDRKVRHPLSELLERKDMVQRRMKVVIPEFYTGTIMAVTTSNVHSPEKVSRFMGICIYKGGAGLRCSFILRNAINGEGFDIGYDLYSPLIQKFEIIRLEKRLDEHLFYLRDALLEYSTFPFDMIPERRPEGSEIPINPLQVVMKPRPWSERWERRGLKGVKEFGLKPKFFVKAKKFEKPWEKYDLMKQYRETIPEEEQQEIFSEVYKILSGQEENQARERRRTLILQKQKRKEKIG